MCRGGIDHADADHMHAQDSTAYIQQDHEELLSARATYSVANDLCDITAMTDLHPWTKRLLGEATSQPKSRKDRGRTHGPDPLLGDLTSSAAG
jgi:uncharacterized protein YciW